MEVRLDPIWKSLRWRLIADSCRDTNERYRICLPRLYGEEGCCYIIDKSACEFVFPFVQFHMPPGNCDALSAPVKQLLGLLPDLETSFLSEQALILPHFPTFQPSFPPPATFPFLFSTFFPCINLSALSFRTTRKPGTDSPRSPSGYDPQSTAIKLLFPLCSKYQARNIHMVSHTLVLFARTTADTA